MIKNFHNSFSENKDFYPPSATNSKITEFLSHRIGMFISYGLTTFTTSDSYATNYLNDPPTPTTFDAPSSVDSAQWATEAANAGCDYAVLTTGHHIGFNIFPYSGIYNNGLSGTTYDSTRGQLDVPVYTRYDVSSVSTADQNIVGKFVDQCGIEGIKCGLYYNIGKNINLRRGLDLDDASYDQTTTYSLTYQNYVDFALMEIEWILREYSPDYLWLDAPHHLPRYVTNTTSGRRYFQDVYNKCKEVSPNTLVIINYDCPETPNRVILGDGTDAGRPPFNFDGTEMVVSPADIISFEYFRIPDSSDDFNPLTSHSGITHYIGREIISTILQGGQYFARNDVFQDLETLVTLQAKYDKAKAENAPFLLNVAVAKNGVIPSNQLTRFGEIVL